MNLLNKLARAGATMAVVAVSLVSVGHVNAGAPGQIAGGNQNYKIANVTKGSGFANPQTADACDVLQYRERLYNPGPSSLSNVKMEASINTMTPYTGANSTATVYTPDGVTKAVAFQAVVNISTAQTQSYVSGSTKLLNSAGTVIQNLPDGVTMGGGGISLGNIGDSVTEYVEFNTKLSCPETPSSSGMCKLLSLAIANKDEREVSASLTGNVDNATVLGYSIDFGDGTVVDQQSANHKYAKDGTYKLVGTVKIKLANGDVQYKTAESCTGEVTFTPNKPPHVTPPPSTPTPPSSLPNTGPGNVIAAFSGVTLLSSVIYYVVSRRLAEL